MCVSIYIFETIDLISFIETIDLISFIKPIEQTRSTENRVLDSEDISFPKTRRETN
jgi:hypothetical protein